jgi:hypothetical protein
MPKLLSLFALFVAAIAQSCPAAWAQETVPQHLVEATERRLESGRRFLVAHELAAATRSFEDAAELVRDYARRSGARLSEDRSDPVNLFYRKLVARIRAETASFPETLMSPRARGGTIELDPERLELFDLFNELAAPRLDELEGSFGFPVKLHRRVADFVRFYSSSVLNGKTAGFETMRVALANSEEYLQTAQEAFRVHGRADLSAADDVPVDFVWIATVESLWRPTAESEAGAVGLFQFMPGTARQIGIDERTDPAQSAAGAARYLTYLRKTYPRWDWLCILGAYNWGEGNMVKAVAANSGIADFWAISDKKLGTIRLEARNYVPAVLASIHIAKNRSRYGFK